MKWLKKVGYYIALPFIIVVGLLVLYLKRTHITPIDKDSIEKEVKAKEKETDEKISNMSADAVANEYLSTDSRDNIETIIDAGTKRILDAIRRNSIGSGDTTNNKRDGG